MKSVMMTILALSLLSPTAQAATSDEKLAACDAALYAKIKEADLCNLGVQLRHNEIERLQTQNAALLSKGSAWYNNPLIWAAIGSIVGVYAGARATR